MRIQQTTVCYLLPHDVSRDHHEDFEKAVTDKKNQFFVDSLMAGLFLIFKKKNEIIAFIVGAIFSAAILRSTHPLTSYLRMSEIAIPMEEFPEPAWRTASTLAVRTITSTPFARFEIHQVRTESGEIVNDWLWTDERSHVNILVHCYYLCLVHCLCLSLIHILCLFLHLYLYLCLCFCFFLRLCLYT